jgi:hypothetical protein
MSGDFLALPALEPAQDEHRAGAFRQLQQHQGCDPQFFLAAQDPFRIDLFLAMQIRLECNVLACRV